MKNKSLSFFKFLFVHKVPLVHSFSFGLMAAGLIGFILDATGIFGNIDNIFLDLMYLAFVIAGILAVPPLLAQYRSITAILQNGIEIQGKITDIYFASGSGYVTYEYDNHGQKYRSSDNINRTHRTKKLQVGQTVGLRLDHTDLKQAYIPEIYI